MPLNSYCVSVRLELGLSAQFAVPLFSGGPYTPVPVFVYFSRFGAVELAGVGTATIVFSHPLDTAALARPPFINYNRSHSKVGATPSSDHQPREQRPT